MTGQGDLERRDHEEDSGASEEATAMKSLETFIQEQGIVMIAEKAPANPDIHEDGPEDRKWAREASHWFCRFFAVKPDSSEGFTCYFSQGSAHTEPPTAVDVLDCLASDAAGVENADEFEDWAPDYGYDVDSRRAYATWKRIQTQRDQLREWLGADVLEELMFKIERL